MTDTTRYALVDASGHVVNITPIGLVYEQVPSIAADGITVNYTDTQVPTTVVPVPTMVNPGDKYVNGQFVRTNPTAPQFAVIRNRDNVLLHFTPNFGSEIAQVVPDPDGIANPGITTWTAEGGFVNPAPPSAPDTSSATREI